MSWCGPALNDGYFSPVARSNVRRVSSSAARPYHHGNLRDAVLESAGRVLREVGVDGLSFRQIARECGVSSAAPRRHFSTRQRLLDELAIVGFGDLSAAMRAADKGGRAEERLRALADSYLDFAGKQ